MEVNYNLIKRNSELRWLSRNQLRGFWGIAILGSILYSLIGGAFPIILMGPMTVGLSVFYLRLIRFNYLRFEDIFEGFKNFGTACLAYIVMSIFIFLWSLLLIVPGIITALSYSMTPYIISDNPSIQPMDALRQSKEMMKGFKWKLFCMNLVCIPWGFVCLFTCGIGFLFLVPYLQLANANFYENLRAAYGFSSDRFMGNNGGLGGNFNNNYNPNTNNANNNNTNPYSNTGNDGMNVYNTNMGGYNGNDSGSNSNGLDKKS